MPTPLDQEQPTPDWERDCETLAEIVQRLEQAPVDAIYLNIDPILEAFEGLGRIYNDWLMDRLGDEDRDDG